MDLQLADKVAVVTGASGGIGRALAEAFAAEGARLGLLGHAHMAELEAWSASAGLGERALCAAADVTDPAEVERAFAEVRARFGRIDVCVANAGAWPRAAQMIHEASPERWRRTLEVNLLGAAWTARAFFGALAASGPRPDGHGASLVFIGSTAGRFGERDHADYAAAKAGLRGLVSSLKNEIVRLDPYGRVNMVEPGWTVTHMVRAELGEPGFVARSVRTMPLRQLARAADIARSVLALASPALARHTTGEVLCVAGGMEGRVQWDLAEIDEERIRARLREG